MGQTVNRSLSTDLYYFFVQILYRLFESYVHHVAAEKLVNLLSKMAATGKFC